jgi:transcriptional regulator with XRE-family HTH domain
MVFQRQGVKYTQYNCPSIPKVYDVDVDKIAYRKALGERIKRAREERKLSQADVAEHFGYISAAVSAWETGRTEAPVSVLTELAELLRVPFTWLAGVAGSIDADLYLVPMKNREFAAKQARSLIKDWADKP